MSLFENEKGVAYKIYNCDGTIDEKLMKIPYLSEVEIEVLTQLVTPVWDGNLISKSARSSLCAKRLASHWNGLNFCTQDGYATLETLGILTNTDRYRGGVPWNK